MARIRTIKPEFWTSEQVTECSLSARLLFIGLWNFADDGGNLSASCKTAKLQIFPSDDVDVEPLIAELLSAKLLVKYSVDDRYYWHITGWSKHQVINRPSPLKHPKLTEGSVITHGALTEHSLKEGKGRERNISSSLRSEDTRARRAAVSSKKFDEFWEAWPNKVGKPVASKSYAKVSDQHDAIMAGLKRYVESKPEDRPWLNPSTFLNQRRWEDVPATSPGIAFKSTQKPAERDLRSVPDQYLSNDQYWAKRRQMKEA